MNILFLSLLDFESIEERNIYTDLLREFVRKGHTVCAVSPTERKKKQPTKLLAQNEKVQILKLRIGNIQKTNLIEKGISTVTVEGMFIKGIKKYFSDIKFDLVLYTTPPITLQKAVNYVKRRDGAKTYLMLKDIFPQNAVDMGMLGKTGWKFFLYRYFRGKEKKLYRDSDFIGCMSQANVEYIKKHNPQIDRKRVEVCPNCMEPTDRKINDDEKLEIRRRLGVPEGKILFVYGGNLGRPQGIPFLIECLREIRENKRAFFLIVGSGTEFPLLEAFVRDEKPENVKLMRALPKRDYDNMIFAADVGMIFLDYRFTIPNFPSRLLSYMDAGLAVLTVTDESTDIGQVVESGKFGISIKSNEAKEFTEAVKVFENADSLNAMKQNSYKYLKEVFDVRIVYDRIMGHFKD